MSTSVSNLQNWVSEDKTTSRLKNNNYNVRIILLAMALKLRASVILSKVFLLSLRG